MFALKLRFPTGYYKENAEIVKKASEILGIELRTDSHPYPQYAIRDALESFNKGQPMKDGQICNSRSLIKVNCIMAPECSGVTHPAELSAWLFSKCDTHYIAAAFTQELVTKGDAPATTAYAYCCLVDNKDPLQMMKLANHQISGSDAVTMRKWAAMDGKKIRILPTELYVADGAVSVVPQKKEKTTRATSATDLVTRLAEEAKIKATQAGLEQSGYTASTQQHTVELLTMQKRRDLAAHINRKRELMAQLEAIENEERMAKELENKEKKGKEEKEAGWTQNKNNTEAQQSRPPSSPSKIKRCEITIEIQTELGDEEELTIEASDVPPMENTQRANLTDLVAYINSIGGFGEGYGIEATEHPEFKKGTAPEISVYVEVTHHPSDDVEAWTVTVGKDAKGKTIKIDTLTKGKLVMKPREATRPSNKHPKWMKVKPGTNKGSPSPKKVAMTAASVRKQKDTTSSVYRHTNQRNQTTCSTPWQQKKTKKWGTQRNKKEQPTRKGGKIKPQKSWNSCEPNTRKTNHRTQTNCGKISYKHAKDSPLPRKYGKSCTHSGRTKKSPWNNRCEVLQNMKNSGTGSNNKEHPDVHIMKLIRQKKNIIKETMKRKVEHSREETPRVIHRQRTIQTKEPTKRGNREQNSMGNIDTIDTRRRIVPRQKEKQGKKNEETQCNKNRKEEHGAEPHEMERE